MFYLFIRFLWTTSTKKKINFFPTFSFVLVFLKPELLIEKNLPLNLRRWQKISSVGKNSTGVLASSFNLQGENSRDIPFSR